jgi:hypothetical protein
LRAAETGTLLLACEGTLHSRYREDVALSRGVTIDWNNKIMLTDIIADQPVLSIEAFTTPETLVGAADPERKIEKAVGFDRYTETTRRSVQITIDRITGNLEASANGSITGGGKPAYQWYESAVMKCHPAQKMF